MNEEHQRFDLQLPWYVNGTLDREEADEIRSHAANCVTCRGRLIELEALREAVDTVPDHGFDRERGLAALRARFGSQRRAGGDQSFMRRLGGGSLRWLVVAQAAALAFALGLVLDQRAAIEDAAEYRTLSAPAASPAAAPRLRLLFTDEITQGEIRALLAGVGGRIVDGPSALGLYVVALDSSAQLEPVATRITVLRSTAGVRFAEWEGNRPQRERDRD